MQKHNPKQGFGPAINRISDLMDHTTRYSIDGVLRLAEDTGLSRKSLYRVLRSEVNPSFFMVARIATALERELKRPIDPRDLLAEHGEFLTRFACDLSGCRGCLPEVATDEFGDRKKAFAEIEAGAWVTSRFPLGYENRKGGAHGN